MKSWYLYTFADGYQLYARGLSKMELAYEESKHGKLIRKEPD